MRVSFLYALAAGIILAVGAAIAPPDLDAQDVEMRGRIHGKELPSGMRDVLARDPTAYQFKRVWIEYARTVRERRQELARAGDFGTLNSHLRGLSASMAAAQASGAALADTFKFPVLTGIFLDSTHVFLPDSTTLNTVLFGSAVGPPYSISTYYEEASDELLAVTGDVINWVTVDSAAAWYEGQSNGGDPATDHTGDFIKALLDSADASVDFSVYDGDGDTFVDLIAVLHPLRDGSCVPSTHIWAHSWSYSAWMGSPYLTDDGVFIDDYIIQSAVGGTNCDDAVPMAVGTMVHELGHGMLGLPDLYDTGAGEADPTSQGIGWWGLMSSGNWNRQDSPAHLSAWSKDMVGWITIQAIAEGAPPGDYLLWPIVDSTTAIRIDLAGTNEYFLLENRHRLGSDAFLAGEGLLIWHVDPGVITQWWPWNEVNAHDPHGLTLEQADGDDDLGNNVNRGDSGDPYPGLSVNREFGPGTMPNSDLNDGTISGIRVDSITRNLPDLSIAFRVAVNLTQKRITTNWPGTEVIVDGLNEDAPYDVIWGFPTGHTIAVDSIQGDTLTRFTFQSWSDGGARSHSIAVDDMPPDTYTANLQAEFRLRAVTDLSGTINSSVTLDLNGTAWLQPGASAQLEAFPNQDFFFVEWSGDTTAIVPIIDLTMNKPYTLRAVFGLQVAVDTDTLAATMMGAAYSDTLEATGGSGSFVWTRTGGDAIPAGLTVDSGTGVFSGAAEEEGDFDIVFQAVSGALSNEDTVTIVITRPDLLHVDVVNHLLSPVSVLTADEENYLDIIGNQNGSFDIGDFRAYLQEIGEITADVIPAASLEAQQDTERSERGVARKEEGR